MMKELIRCGWCGTDPVYMRYHDEEWGRPVDDEQKLFEFLLLEGAQAGLSWITILRRREAYRNAFAGFDPHKVAAFDARDEERLLQDAGIIRNKLKIKSAGVNARLFLSVQEEFGSFANYLWSFMPAGKPLINQFKSLSEVPARTEISDALSKDMKRRGFKFFGTTICYAFMQAVGLVDDHLISCHCRTAHV